MISRSSHLPSRIATTVLRATPRIYPVPGWFPVVVERLHPLVNGTLDERDVVTHGVRLRLDLRDYIQRRIFYESHEPHQLRFVERFLRPGDVVLDVGAHVGIFSLLSASTVGSAGEVHAFEPVPANFAQLDENVRLNGFENIVLNLAAVGAEEGETSLGLPEVVPDAGITSAMYTVGGSVNEVTAPVIALDSYVEKRLPDRPIRLLKMDVEGLEPSVLAGFARHLADSPPDAIVLEVNLELIHRHGLDPDELVHRLLDADYRLFRPTAFGRLKEFEPDLPEVFDHARDLPAQEPGLGGWLRRYRAESRIFFNVVAVQAGVPARAVGSRPIARLGRR